MSIETLAQPFQAAANARRQGVAEVCVIGAGYAGLSSAYHLALAGYDTVVLEAGAIGSGASGRNGGQVMPGFAADPGAMLAALGPARAKDLWDLSVQAVAKTRALAGTVCDIDPQIAILAAHPNDLGAIEEAATIRRDVFADRHISLVDRDGLAKRVATYRHYGGAIDTRAFALDPRKYVHALARHALAAGARIDTHRPVLGLARNNGVWTLATPSGELRAAHVVLAANIDIPGLAPAAAGLAAPMRTFMLETEPHANAAGVLRDLAAAFDTSAMLRYFRRTADGRLQFGGGGWPSRTSPPFAQWLLRRAMVRMFPSLAGVRIARGWSGLVDVTSDGLPRFAHQDGLVRLLGFCGHGIALATLAGQLAADAIDAQNDRLALVTGLSQTRIWPTAVGRTAQLAIQSFSPGFAKALGLATA